jgi:N-acetylmuramoyl-L-alanine amidase
VFVFSLMSVSQAAASKDDITGHWAEDHMRALVERGVMVGTGPNQYSPDNNVTRAEFATLVSKALQLPPSEKSFPDLGQAFPGLQDGVKKAAGAGVVAGGTDGNFYPNKNMSRQEMAVMIDNAMKYKGKQSTVSMLPFADKDAILYKDAVGRIAGASLISGYPDNTFGPYDTSSRAMAAVVLSRMLGYIEGASIVPEKPKPQPEPEQPQQKLPFIVIDPGHGGSDPGSGSNGLVEKELTLDVSLKVKKLLTNNGIPHALTREKDVFVSLPDRVTFAKEKNADLFVSIHGNSYSSSSANGAETFYHANSLSAGASTAVMSSPSKPARQDSKALATYIQKRLVEKLKMADRGVKQGNFHVIRETPMAAVLAELGFITNANDRAKLMSQEYRQKAAEAIYLGVTDYLKVKGYKL